MDRVGVWIGIGVLAPVLASCAATADQLKARASLDLDCPRTELAVSKIDASTSGVNGCGRKAIYIESCNQRTCTWVLNSDVDQPAAAVAVSDAAEPEPATQDARIEVVRDDKGAKQFKLYLRNEAWLVYIRATPSDGSNQARLVVRRPAGMAAGECEVKWVANGERLRVAGATVRSNRQSTVDYAAALPYEELARMAKGSRVVGRLCELEMTLTESQLVRLRELVMRIGEELAWDDDPGRSPKSEPREDGSLEL